MALVATRPTPQTRPTLSLTAAASRRSLSAGTSRLNVQSEGWQDRMWHFYDHLGAVHYGVTFKRNAASKVSYFAAEVNGDDPDQGPVETKNQQVIDAVDRLHSGYGDINEIVAELMILINLLGEGYLVGVDGVEGEEWDVWSIEEVRDSQFAAFLELEPDRVTADDGAFACRIWRPHPRHRHKADAPLRPVAEQCEQLLLLEDSISAAAKSRLAAGFLLVPSEFDIGDGTAFEDQVIAVLTTPIKDSESASRWAPGLIRGPSEHLDKLRVLSFSREIDEKFAGMREELTRSIAAGLDLPAEIILGKGDLNHWTGWDIDESAFRDHIDPDIILILDSITRGYLQPALIEGGMGEEEAARYLIWRDLSDLGQQPPTIAEALEMHAAGTVDDQYIRDLAGVHDDYIPDEPPPAPEVVEIPMPIPQGPPVQQDQLVATVNTTYPAAGTHYTISAPGLVAAEPKNRGRPLTELSNIDRRLLDRILEASEAAFNRVLERAGAKIRSHARKDRAISLTIDRLPNDQVTRHLGEKLTAQLQITPSELVPPDSFDPLLKRLRVIMNGAASEVEATLEALTGVRPTLDAARIQRAIGHYATQLEGFSLKLLFNPLDAGPGEVGDSVVPQGMVMDMMTVASGGKPSEGPSDVRGFATGQESLDFLEKNGYTPTGHLWEYGDSSTRQRPFPPHRRLDGAEFSDWDSEELATPPSASFLNVGHMFPGDHYRCQCRTVPVVIQPPGPEAPGIRPDEPTPLGPTLSWEQFGMKLPSIPERRTLLNEALQRLNGLDPEVRDRFVDLLGRFPGGVSFKVATPSTKSLAEIGKVTFKTSPSGELLREGRQLQLHLSRPSEEWQEWVRPHNAEHHRLAAMPGSQPGVPNSPYRQGMNAWKEANPEPARWRLATPDEIADTLIHELGHQNDLELMLERSARVTPPRAIQDKVWEMYWGTTKEGLAEARAAGTRVPVNEAYEYATSKSVEMVAELQKFYLRGVHDSGLNLSALEWRAAHPELASWVKENLLP